ncbi:uncharacterized protein LOC128730128 [Anopheles nili]|uniref:uncharacterized protein LOC128730128 n=1 Tax=Anopheles nili TaxID=185578 RepID=UPI00237B0CF0|nr:uncharacterized protein LOC128730128 [Anopheles nili]
MAAIVSRSFTVILLVGLCTFGSPAALGSQTKPNLHHYEYHRVQDSNQSWICWQETYRPSKETSDKFHESANGTVSEIQRILRFNQSTTVLFKFNSNSENQNLRTEFTIERNKLVILSLDNAGLERLSLGRDDNCRLAELSVPRNRLGKVPDGIERLTALRKLDFSYNLLEAFNLDLLAKATGMKLLLLKNNRIESFVSRTPILFGNLQRLDLSHNRLATLDSANWNMPRLEHFHIDRNHELKMIVGWSKKRFPLVEGFDPSGTNNWNQTWLRSVQ